MPGPAYNWFCVVHSILNVLSNAAAIRASQIYPHTASAAAQRNLKRRTVQPVGDAEDRVLGPLIKKSPENPLGRTGDAHIGVFHMHPQLFGLV